MATLNKKTERDIIKTHEGGIAKRIDVESQLRRSIMANMLWEKTFYEDGQDVAERIKGLIPKVKAEKVLDMAIEAREKMNLRHIPLLILREMARVESHKGLVARGLERVIQRPDELTEFLSIYWKDGKEKLSSQVKKGLAKAFVKFNPYQLAKYNRDGKVKLRDVLFLSHPKPLDNEQRDTWKKLVDNTLEIPDTWETNLSAGKDKKTTWERLINERKLGGLAFLRNLRNMSQVGVEEKIVEKGFDEMKVDRILPFRFIAAARYAPQWESKIEEAMFRCTEGREKLSGKTILLLDVSGSMGCYISEKSEMTCMDAAMGVGVLLREICDYVSIYTFSEKVVRVPSRKGFALRDAIKNSQFHGGTYLQKALSGIKETADRIIVITDEQTHDTVSGPKGSKGYVVNVSPYKNGVGYGKWMHIDGWSDAVIDYIRELEKVEVK